MERANQDVQRMLHYAMVRHGVGRPEDRGNWIIHLEKVRLLLYECHYGRSGASILTYHNIVVALARAY